MIWSPITIAPGGLWTAQIVVTVDLEYEGSLTNVVQVSSEEGAAGSYAAPSTVEWLYYLPIILRDH